MILLALNELNLDYIKGYVSTGKLSNFGKPSKGGLKTLLVQTTNIFAKNTTQKSPLIESNA